MILTIGRNGRPNPARLPCGCPTVGNTRAIGIDGEIIEGLTGLNTKTGWMRIQRWAVDPRYVLKPLVRDPATGEVLQRRQVGQGGVDPVNVSAPFELRCKTHGKVEEP